MSNSFFNWSSSPSRLVRFDTARAEDINAALDSASSGFDGVEIKTNAAIKLPDGETAGAIGSAVARANKVLSFDASGNPVTALTADEISNAQAYASAASADAAIATAQAGISTAQVAVATAQAGISTAQAAVAVAQSAAAANSASLAEQYANSIPLSVTTPGFILMSQGVI